MPRYLDLDPALLPGFSQVLLPEAVGSTNVMGQELLMQDGAARRALGVLSLVATGEQTAGRGRLDRSWSVPPGTAVSASFIVRPHADPSITFPMESYHWMTLLVALAAVQSLEEISGIKPGIKWPNDVLIGNKKMCGILAQLVAEPDGKLSLVAGIGTNLNLKPEDLPVETATSLLTETGQEYNLNNYLHVLANNFEKKLRSFFAVGGDPQAPQSHGLTLLDSIRANMITLGQDVKIHLPNDKYVNGTATDINQDGEILVRLTDGSIKNYAVGDVVHLRPRA